MNPWFAREIVYRSIGIARREKVLTYLRQVRSVPFQPMDQIKLLQREKLAKILAHASRHSVYYRELFDQHGLSAEKGAWPEDLVRLPLLNKETLQKNPEALITVRDSRPVSIESTSGSQGAPLLIAVDRCKSAHIRALMFRNYGWYGIQVGDPQARFWGMPTSAKLAKRERLKDLLANRIRLSAFDVDDAAFDRFLQQLRRFKPTYFYGYPSLISRFASWLTENRIDTGEFRLAAVITSGELLHGYQRETIAGCFDCPVVNEYGTTETGIIAFECSHGKLHINSDHLYLESVGSGENQGRGSLVVTELNNYYNPLIRYALGDLGSISEEACSCGCGFPVLEELAGREGNFILTPGNRKVFSAVLSYTLKEGIAQFQAVQQSREELIVKIVRQEGWNETLHTRYRDALSRALGDEMKVTFEFVPAIQTDKSGKLRYFVSNLKS
jgi:phenylacetate-CoA ligase